MKNFVKIIFICLVFSAAGVFAQNINLEFEEYSQKRIKHYTKMKNTGIILTASGTAIAAAGVFMGTKYALEDLTRNHTHDSKEEVLEGNKKTNELYRKQTIWYSIGIVGGALMSAGIPLSTIGAKEIKWWGKSAITAYLAPNGAMFVLDF